MYGAYIFAKTVREADWKVSQHLAEMGSPGHPACLPQSHESALLHTCAIFAVSWVDLLRARQSDCVCSRVLPFAKERPRYPERSASRLLPRPSHQSGSVDGRYRFCAELQTKRIQ